MWKLTKKIQFILLIISLNNYSVIYAAGATIIDRPGKPTDTKVFSDMDNFQDYYLKLYKNNLVLDRSQKKINGTDLSIRSGEISQIFSVKDQKNIEEQQKKEREQISDKVRNYRGMEDWDIDSIDLICYGDTSNLERKQKLISSDQHAWDSGFVRSLCEFEKSNLSRQKILSKNNALMSNFINATVDDSPFDLIVDLNKIDAILFGEKFTDPPKPDFSDIKKAKTRVDKQSYVPYESKIPTETEGDKKNRPNKGVDKKSELSCEESDEGRDQESHCSRDRAEVSVMAYGEKQLTNNGLSTLNKPQISDLPRVVSLYKNEDNSIAGHFQNLLDTFHQLNTYHHSAECASTRMFQPPFVNLCLASSNRLAFKIFFQNIIDQGSPQRYPLKGIDRDGKISQGNTLAENSIISSSDKIFKEIESLIMDEESCNESSINKSLLSQKSLQNLNKDKVLCEGRKQSEHDNRQIQLQNQLTADRDALNFQHMKESVNAWDRDFEIWLQAMTLIEESFHRLSEKNSIK